MRRLLRPLSGRGQLFEIRHGFARHERECVGDRRPMRRMFGQQSAEQASAREWGWGMGGCRQSSDDAKKLRSETILPIVDVNIKQLRTFDPKQSLMCMQW